uniref:NADH dehydrogenase [ubiquinone] 1 subunit C1, mitochondrial n=1 Tax=Ailuropoda melanoleuca TaxID=9646 RepID=A0A7N5KHE5_AILME
MLSFSVQGNTLSIYRHCPLSASARSKFYVREPPHDRPDWLKVGLTLGTSVFLWIYLIKQHNEDVLEYKRRNGLE